MSGSNQSNVTWFHYLELQITILHKNNFLLKGIEIHKKLVLVFGQIYIKIYKMCMIDNYINIL